MFAERYLESLAQALFELGGEAGAVIHAASGRDEIAGEGPTHVVQFDRSGMRRWTLHPQDYGVHAPLESLRGGDVAFNAAALVAILEGEQSPRADLVCLNAALGLEVAGVVADLTEGLQIARKAIASGAAREALDALRGEPSKEYAV